MRASVTAARGQPCTHPTHDGATPPLPLQSRTGGAIGMLIYMLLSAPTYALTLNGVPDALKVGLGVFAPVSAMQAD